MDYCTYIPLTAKLHLKIYTVYLSTIIFFNIFIHIQTSENYVTFLSSFPLKLFQEKKKKKQHNKNTKNAELFRICFFSKSSSLKMINFECEQEPYKNYYNTTNHSHN